MLAVVHDQRPGGPSGRTRKTGLLPARLWVNNASVAIPQSGIFALGTPAHTYLEFDRTTGTDAGRLASAVALLTARHLTTTGVNLVVGFRPTLWGQVAAGASPTDIADFDTPIEGPDGCTMAATQHDLLLWIAGGDTSAVFDAAIELITSLADAAALVDETTGWGYHRDLDLTGFIDGIENPPLSEVPAKALVQAGARGEGGSVLLLQKWAHDSAAWGALTVAEQERVIGRRKADGVELPDRPETSHVARTDQAEFGTIFRRNTAYGSASEHGTMFVGFSAAQAPLASMLQSMAGITTGERDALTSYARAVTGSFYFVPSLDDLNRLLSCS